MPGSTGWLVSRFRASSAAAPIASGASHKGPCLSPDSHQPHGGRSKPRLAYNEDLPSESLLLQPGRFRPIPPMRPPSSEAAAEGPRSVMANIRSLRIYRSRCASCTLKANSRQRSRAHSQYAVVASWLDEHRAGKRPMPHEAQSDVLRFTLSRPKVITATLNASKRKYVGK
jgi:hypothetical protein